MNMKLGKVALFPCFKIRCRSLSAEVLLNFPFLLLSWRVYHACTPDRPRKKPVWKTEIFLKKLIPHFQYSKEKLIASI